LIKAWRGEKTSKKFGKKKWQKHVQPKLAS